MASGSPWPDHPEWTVQTQALDWMSGWTPSALPGRLWTCSGLDCACATVAGEGRPMHAYAASQIGEIGVSGIGNVHHHDCVSRQARLLVPSSPGPGTLLFPGFGKRAEVPKVTFAWDLLVDSSWGPTEDCMRAW